MDIRKGTESRRQFSYFDKKPDKKYMTDTYVMITGADLGKILTVLRTTVRWRRKNLGGSGGMPPPVKCFQF